MAKRIPVLLISKRQEVAEAFRRDPDAARYVLTVRSPRRVDEEEAAHNYQVAVIDSEGFPEAVDLGRRLRTRNDRVEFIPLVSAASEAHGVEALKHGAFDYQLWPAKAPELWSVLARCLDQCKPIEEQVMGPFGPYRLYKKIATGGMADVFLAQPLDPNTDMGSPVVIKRIREAMAQRPEFVTMFMDEARISSLLRHPNIVRVLDFGRAQGLLYMAMEYVPGCNLQAVGRATGWKVRPEIAAYIVAEVADALDYAHSCTDETGEPLGIVHRDVNPPNILLSNDGHVKLADFGIAKARQRYAETTLGMIKGKADYMSPEQVAQKKTLDGRSDVFSLAIILYELVTGVHPFRGAAPVDTFLRIREANPKRPSELVPELDGELEAILLRALAGERSQRYQRASQLAQQLRSWVFAQAEVGPRQLRGYIENVLDETAKELPLT